MIPAVSVQELSELATAPDLGALVDPRGQLLELSTSSIRMTIRFI
jgi:hypothetical protein